MKPSIVLAAAVLLLSTSAVVGQKVQVDVDKTVNFSTFKTFGWAKGIVARNPIISQMIIAAVESELTARGLTKSDDNPDIKVAVLAAAGMDIQAVGPTWNSANYRTWGGYTNPAALMNITTGTLLVDLVDTRNDIGVFRGVAKDTLTRPVSADMKADAKSVEKVVKQAVSKMFKKYPIQKSR
ncbi:MAG TPA: DUF4136 domain-containing protein [Pyrinomonadaceae bacterium]|nr:DUF4136 domain-containing protein [Pyrinomonadaceae bacterium]